MKRNSYFILLIIGLFILFPINKSNGFVDDISINASVVNRNIYSFFDEYLIDKGYDQNISKGDLVLNNDSVVGTVSDVYKNTSRIKLITNRNFKISVKVGDAFAIFCNNQLYNVINKYSIKIGDKVYTSGLTEIPADYLVGEVINITNDNIEVKISGSFYFKDVTVVRSSKL